jgi:CsoR family transcriptional regulator, copper-sensing transcriptional repressor
MIRAKNTQEGIPPSHDRQLPRLKRVEGQVRGLQQMIKNERDCIEVTHQVSAVIAALRRVQGDMLRDHLRKCAKAALAGVLPAAKAKRLIDEIGDLLTKWK